MLTVTPEYLAQQGLNSTAVQRFWKYVQKTNSCWLWTGAISRSLPKWGHYGMMFAHWENGKTVTMRAHVVSYIIHKGPVPKGLEVCHNCPGRDNELCVNPAHLWAGPHKENMADMKNKGRANGGATFGMPQVKLTPEEILEIRRLYRSPNRQVAAIAEQFGLCRRHVWMIGSGRSWPNLGSKEC